MSNYTKSTNFATKDNLSPGDPLKIVRGTEIDTEFNNISTAISTKTDNSAAAITGGSITGITDLAVADGGTGASTATAALNNLLPSQTGNGTKYLQTDGSNATWDAVSLSTSDITGTLPVANGGTGVTSSTGTGSVVLSNSPTLVTPALGTPASGVATNITGLPISTGVSGLGTGVATFLGTPSSANLISAVTDETGTGSLVFANSPTLVTPALGTPSALVGTNITGTASGLTAGNVTTNANLTGAVTSVGNASSLGSFTSSQLAGALTDETGSGSAVFATSPTLVTPILGTPTSATLTNATGLPIATGVSGLGTGVATALAVNVGSSGAPLVNGGVLGTPSSGTATNLTGLPLTTGVTGTLPTANGGTNLTSFTSGGVVYASSSSALATGSALSFNGTKLGVSIGAATVSLIGAGVNIATGGSNTNTVGTSLGLDGVGGTTLSGIRWSGTAFSGVSGNQFVTQFVTDSANSLATELVNTGNTPFVFGINNAETLRLTSSSLYTASGINVGIGLSSPTAKLQIQGTKAFLLNLSGAQLAIDANGNASNGLGGIGYNWYEETTGNTQLFRGGSGNQASSIRFDGNIRLLVSNGAGNADGAITWATGLYVANAGNVGIGTSSPSAKLSVVNTGANSSISMGDTAASSYSTLLMYGGSGKYNFQLGVQTNVNNAFEITPSTATGGTTFSTPALVVYSNGTVSHRSTVSVGDATPSTSGAGITFPATQSASSDANTLDDYEEGTWTPTFKGGDSDPTVTFTTAFGTYTKVGRFVTLTYQIVLATISGGSGALIIGGFPFAASSTGAVDGSVGSGNVYITTGFSTNFPQAVGPNPSGIFGYVTYQNGNAATGYVTVANAIAGCEMRGTINYITST